MFHSDSGQPSMSNIRSASKVLRRFRPPPGAQMIRLSCSMVTTTRTLARPATERFAKLQNAYQLMKDTNHDIPPI
jgi:hypothetical protein